MFFINILNTIKKYLKIRRYEIKFVRIDRALCLAVSCHRLRAFLCRNVFLTFELSVSSTIVYFFFFFFFVALLSVTGHLPSFYASTLYHILRCHDLFRNSKRLVYILRARFLVYRSQQYLFEIFAYNAFIYLISILFILILFILI